MAKIYTDPETFLLELSEDLMDTFGLLLYGTSQNDLVEQIVELQQYYKELELDAALDSSHYKGTYLEENWLLISEAYDHIMDFDPRNADLKSFNHLSDNYFTKLSFLDDPQALEDVVDREEFHIEVSW